MKIIAEIGSNVKSELDCYDSITIAKGCGADAVKFQYFTDKEMYGFDRGNKPIIDPSWIPKLKVKADATGIEFMCTFFSPESLFEYRNCIDTIKIASSDMLYSDLLETAKDLNKPILLSTGGQSLSDISKAVKVLQGSDLTLMYCESGYPAQYTDFRKLDLLRDLNKKLGFSDHSLEVYTNPLIARDLGLEYIEKHVNFCNYKDTPDAKHSLGLHEFMAMAKAIKNEEAEISMRSREEKEMVKKYNRRLIAMETINEGDRFDYSHNFGQFRSINSDTNGLPGYAWLEVDGKIAKRRILKGESIGPREL